VAIKVIENDNDPGETLVIERECNILRTIEFACFGLDGLEEFSIVRYYKSFKWKKNMCLVFEKLDQSLFEYHKQHNFEPLPMSFLQPVAEQLLKALSKLKSIGIIHADLKLDKIMLVDSMKYPCKI